MDIGGEAVADAHLVRPLHLRSSEREAPERSTTDAAEMHCLGLIPPYSKRAQAIEWSAYAS